MNTNKVAIVGPPHSGKSVFLGGLTALLPRAMHYLFRACPDGEGTWTWQNEAAAKYRRKGSFTKEIVSWYCRKLAKAELAPLTLVDLGGRISKENKRILVEGRIDCAIILAGDLQAVPEWKQFLQDCGVKLLATIHSDYHGKMDKVDGPVPSVHYLERGEDVTSRPVLKKIAAMLLDMVEKKKGNDMDNIILEISNLATEIGKKMKEITLPNGKVISTIQWEGADLIALSRLLHNSSADLPEHVMINGGAPAWLVTAIVHECHPRSVSLNSPDGYVAVGCQKPAGDGAGAGLEFTVERHEDYVLVTAQQEDPSVPLDPKDLGNVAPPAVQMEDVIVLSGRMPNWMMASFAMSYHGIAKAVACFQPGVGATVALTHSASVELGSLIQVD